MILLFELVGLRMCFTCFWFGLFEFVVYCLLFVWLLAVGFLVQCCGCLC